jgi:hypothetical protein
MLLLCEQVVHLLTVGQFLDGALLLARTLVILDLVLSRRVEVSRFMIFAASTGHPAYHGTLGFWQQQ